MAAVLFKPQYVDRISSKTSHMISKPFCVTHQPLSDLGATWKMQYSISFYLCTGENLDAVTAVTDSSKMADGFAGEWTGGAVAQTSAKTIGISVWQGRMWVNRCQGIHNSGWQVVVIAKSAIVDPRDAAVTACMMQYQLCKTK